MQKRRNGAPGRVMELSPVLKKKKEKKIKKNLILNGRKGVVTPHPAKLPACEKESKA